MRLEHCQVRGERRKLWQAVSRADEEDGTGWELDSWRTQSYVTAANVSITPAGNAAMAREADRDSPGAGRRLITQDNQPWKSLLEKYVNVPWQLHSLRH